MISVYDLIIIGGGPAAMTVGIYAGRQRLNILLIAKNFGGQLAKKAVDIENYPGFEKIGGIELGQKFEKHMRHQKIDIERDEVISLKKANNIFCAHTSSKKKFYGKAVIIATGADPRPLEVPGEKKFIGKGVSYCTACDGPMFTGKDVAVIGGGNSGFEAVQSLRGLAKKIYILEYSDKIMADSENQDIVKKIKHAEIITGAQVKKIDGEKFVKSLTYLDRKSKKEVNLVVEGVFVEIGSHPSTSFAKDVVDFNDKDEIMVDFGTCQTKTPGLYAVGDVNAGKVKQIVTACGEGAKAALLAFNYIQKLK